MTPLDAAPEQRRRRTLDRRNRRAKLKVDRLLRDFGCAELGIEARPAGVALGLAPSLRDAGRWEGSCSIRGRLPRENRRKDLEAAGRDLDDEAAACPQCRGVG